MDVLNKVCGWLANHGWVGSAYIVGVFGAAIAVGVVSLARGRPQANMRMRHEHDEHEDAGVG